MDFFSSFSSIVNFTLKVIVIRPLSFDESKKGPSNWNIKLWDYIIIATRKCGPLHEDLDFSSGNPTDIHDKGNRPTNWGDKVTTGCFEIVLRKISFFRTLYKLRRNKKQFPTRKLVPHQRNSSTHRVTLWVAQSSVQCAYN